MTNAQLQIALEIATLAHKNVTRRNGDPYVFHVLRVANNTKFINTKLQKIGGTCDENIIIFSCMASF